MGIITNKIQALNEKKMARMIDSWGLHYNFGSIHYILDYEGVSLEQCAYCLFEGDTADSVDVMYNLEKAVRILLIAGHVQYGDFNYDEENKLALDRMDEWRRRFGNIAILQMTLIGILKNRDFFSERLLDTVEVASGLAKIAELKKTMDSRK